MFLSFESLVFFSIPALIAVVVGVGFHRYATNLEFGPEETFRKLEEKLRNASSVRVHFRWEWRSMDKGKPVELHDTGTMLLGSGNRAHLSIDCEGKALTILSDGHYVRVGNLNYAPVTSDASEILGAGLRIRMARAGIASGLLLAVRVDMIGPAQAGKGDRVSDLAHGEEKNGAKSLTYRLIMDEFAGGAFRQQLWYDPRTYTLLRRFVKPEDSDETVMEFYDEITLNAPTPDDQFTIGR